MTDPDIVAQSAKVRGGKLLGIIEGELLGVLEGKLLDIPECELLEILEGKLLGVLEGELLELLEDELLGEGGGGRVPDFRDVTLVYDDPVATVKLVLCTMALLTRRVCLAGCQLGPQCRQCLCRGSGLGPSSDM